MNYNDRTLCQAIIAAANLKDKYGKYVYKNLHEIYDTLNRDNRTFIIQNTDYVKLDQPMTLARFDIREINSSRTDFKTGIINIDFNHVKGLPEPQQSLIQGFKLYQGLIGKLQLELDEAFGHEGTHAVYDISRTNLLEAIKVQSLINEELDLLQIHDRAGALRDENIAQPYLDAGELNAQQNEQKINEELTHPPE